MYSATALWLVGVSSFFGGMVFIILLFAKIITSQDRQVEKAGVWVNEERAYLLTLIDPRQSPK
jgi:hypothetical protein